MLRDDGGVIDDLIAYYRSAGSYRLVVNAATADGDLAWISQQSAGFEVSVTPRRDLAIVAVQGPQARRKAAACLDAECREAALELGVFNSLECADKFVARTGYTGEDGFEIIMPVTQAASFWRALVAIGVAPCGLGARDTLRLEAGMNLYGNDMDSSVTPLESGLDWTVALEGDRDFIGKVALQAQLAAGVGSKLVGLILEGRGVLRAHQKVVVAGVGDGEVTSGTFSPTLERSIGLARVPAGTGDRVQVDIRDKLLDARVVKPPFVRHGKAMIEL
jgi:aminomethyltransferase